MKNNSKKKQLLLTVTSLVCTMVLTGCVSKTVGKKPLTGNTSKASKAYFNLGVEYFKRGRYDVAETKLQRSLNSEQSPQAFNALALTYEATNNNALAEDTYEDLITIFPDFSLGYMNYHIFLCKYNRTNQIASLAQKMSTKGKEIAAIGQIAAGNCAVQNKNDDLAISHFNNALKYEPYSAGALLPLAQINLSRGFAREAKRQVDLVNNHIGYSPRSVYLSILANAELGNRQEERHMMGILKSRYASTPEARKLFK